MVAVVDGTGAGALVMESIGGVIGVCGHRLEGIGTATDRCGAERYVAVMQTEIGRLGLVAFDCPDALALADFYHSIIGGDIVPGDADGWVELHTPTGRLGFQQIEDHRRPTWPDGDVPQQAHVDIDVQSLADGERSVVRLGAVKADVQPEPDEFLVFVDPAGHPFCLVRSATPF